MSNDYFQFKQFLVKQHRAAFKVGTDSVLLGAWADVSNVHSVLDIGTGTGLLALMMAQRCEARVTGIEIDGPSFRQALDNAARSPWSERVEILQISLQDFAKTGRMSFDLIISNPPYFSDSRKSGDRSKDVARHDIRLSFSELIKGANHLLAGQGRFCLVIPSDMVGDIIADCRASDLYLHRQLAVKPTESLPVKRHLLEFSCTSAEQVDEKEIAIERSARHEYTEEYVELTRDFYLAF